MSIRMHLRYKYSDENAGFCKLCINDFKILKFWWNYGHIYEYRQILTEKCHRCTPPPPPPMFMWHLMWTKSMCDAFLSMYSMQLKLVDKLLNWFGRNGETFI